MCISLFWLCMYFLVWPCLYFFIWPWMYFLTLFVFIYLTLPTWPFRPTYFLLCPCIFIGPSTYFLLCPCMYTSFSDLTCISLSGLVCIIVSDLALVLIWPWLLFVQAKLVVWNRQRKRPRWKSKHTGQIVNGSIKIMSRRLVTGYIYMRREVQILWSYEICQLLTMFLLRCEMPCTRLCAQVLVQYYIWVKDMLALYSLTYTGHWTINLLAYLCTNERPIKGHYYKPLFIICCQSLQFTITQFYVNLLLVRIWGCSNNGRSAHRGQILEVTLLVIGTPGAPCWLLRLCGTQ